MRLMTMTSTAMTALIKGYQLLVSPIVPNCCRFAPSCSHYAVEALQCHGPIRGGYLAAARLLRCHPWARWGYDPVPDVFTFRPWRDDHQVQGHPSPGTFR
jgi:putative membrane protein insertion efficiency factor